MEWKLINRYPYSHEVSDEGQVRHVKTHHILKQSPTGWGGRPQVCIGSGTALVQTLVAEVFLDPRPKGTELCHGDGDFFNNRATNLRWDTHSNNIKDCVSHGTHYQSRKMQCPYGHDYTPENTRWYKGGRYCRACSRRTSREYRQSKTKVVQ